MYIKAGTILTLSTGEYSDYCFEGPFRVLRDFDQVEAVEQHKAQWKPAPGSRQRDPSPNTFIGWLNREGFIEDIEPALTWHIGSYGRFEPEIDPEPNSSEEPHR